MGAVADKIEELISRCDTSVRHRRRIEIRIVRRVIRDLLKAGYKLHAVENDWPGEEENIQIDNGVPALDYLFNLDEERVFVSSPDTEIKPGYGTGTWIQFVFGNDGYDVLSDYTVNLDHVLTPINEWVDKLEEEGR